MIVEATKVHTVSVELTSALLVVRVEVVMVDAFNVEPVSVENPVKE